MGRGRMLRVSCCAAALFVLAGCTGEAPQKESDGGNVIVPGAPGEQAKVVPGERAAERHSPAEPNEADVRFMTMMIPHHRQAITMTDLVPDRVSDKQVRAMAERIAVSQDAEITAMRNWLDDHGKHDHDMAHGRMPGMATPEQLDRLRAASGPEFDRLFLQLMITHHQGALTMAAKHQANGIEQRALEMTQDVLAGQTAEIERMRDLLEL